MAQIDYRLPLEAKGVNATDVTQKSMANEQALLNAELNNLNAMDKRRLDSVIRGAASIKPLLDAGDVEGAKKFAQARLRDVLGQVDRGEASDADDTIGAIQLLNEGRVDELKQQVDALYGLGMMTGSLKRPTDDTSATIQVVNEMQKAAQMANDPRLSQQQRDVARHRYELLNQVQKSYAIDRGMTPQVPNFYGAVGSQQAQPMVQQQPMQQQAQAQRAISPPPADFAMQVLQNAVTPVGQQAPQQLQALPQGGGVSSIPGYNEALAQREAQIEQSKSRAKYMEEGFQSLPRLQRTLQTVEQKEKNLSSISSEVRAKANRITTGFGGAISSAVPGTPAYDLKLSIDTLLANAGFDALQEMRNNSPTGGALGQVTERELGLLQSTVSPIYLSQSTGQFLSNLKRFEEQRAQSLANIRKAYEEDYARFGGASDANLPAPQQKKRLVFDAQGNLVSR